MSIPERISALIEDVNENLVQIEVEATRGIELSRRMLALFPDNAKFIQFFASFSSAILFVDLQQRRITSIVENLSTTDEITEAETQEIGEDLSEEFGTIIETKLLVNNLTQRLEDLL